MQTRATHTLAILVALPIAFSLAGCKRGAEAPAPKPTEQSAAPDVARVVETETVATEPVTGSIVATGRILVAEDRVANVGPVHEGRLVRIFAGQGAEVRKGQKLAELESPDIDDAEAEYLKALADLDNARRTAAADVKLAQATYDRTKMLVERTISAGKNLEAAERDLEVARAAETSTVESAKVAVAAARRRLLILGLTDADVDALPRRPGLQSTFSLVAPIGGVVVERNATLGANVGTDATVFKIVDVSRVWIDANVFEKDIQRVRLGQDVRVTVPAYPGKVFAGKVILVSTVLDPETRTLAVRTEVANGDGRLKPDMFASCEIVTDVGRSAISVLTAAVLADEGKQIVFVANGSDYARREVTVGTTTGDRVEILDGLQPGDRVVIKGNTLLLQQQQESDQ